MGQVVHQVGRRAAWVRLFAYAFTLQLLAASCVVFAVRARSDAALLRAGALLMSYAGAIHQQAPRTLMLNGAAIQLSVGTTDDSVATVLDHFQRSCEQGSGALGRQLHEALSKRGRPTAKPRSTAFDGVLRMEDRRRGVVACVDTGTQEMSLAELASRASTVVRTGDLSQFGQLRFVSVERGESATVFAASWTEGALNIQEMFPATGDAPGQDPPEVPRPPGSRRILSTWEVGQHRSLGVYEVEGSMAKVAREFRTSLHQAGFSTPNGDAPDNRGFVAERSDAVVMIAFAQSDATHTVVTISSLSDATAAVTAR